MIIKISKGSGIGKTKLAAFDRALFEAGIANYNLITLSSVIPPNTKVILEKPEVNKDEYGHKLYCVLAVAYADMPGEQAWSGLGWVHHSDGSGKGLFVEHDGGNEKEVENFIKASLESMAEYRPEERGSISHEVCGATCESDPVCSLVVAVYKSEGWE